jgi:hypothetical protein
MSDRQTLVRALAEALLDGKWLPAPMSAHAASVLGVRPRWLSRVLAKVRAEFPQPRVGGRDELAHALEREGLRNRTEDGDPISPHRFPLVAARMGPRRWPVPELPTPKDLADSLEVEAGSQ